jgi:alkylation response protein AidB-like acyl-CoA dehydrogenase
MNLRLTPEEEAFGQEVRAFAAANVPADIREAVLSGRHATREQHVRWQKILFAKGWGAPNWPVEFGGTGWSSVQQHIFHEECAAAGAPAQIPFGPRMVAPVIMAFGDRSQQQRFLPKIVSGEHWWCQGYSEPGSGSDLASLKTRAERRGDCYVVNGQKTWTTLAQYADWMFCLVRTATEGRPQEGISFLLIDMRTLGVNVRPIITLDGAHEINEVWLEDVHVPVENRIGEENKGWACAKYLLTHERTGIADIGGCKVTLKRIKARVLGSAMDRAFVEAVRLRDSIARLELELIALEMTVLRVLAADARRGAPGPESSILKIKASELQQALAALEMHAAGPLALLRSEQHGAGDASSAAFGVEAARYFNMRKTTIYSGSNEIQRNIVAQHILNL